MRTFHRTVICSALVQLAFVVTHHVQAQDASPAMCAPVDKLDKYRFLRQVSLDLRGRPPTLEEYQALDSTDFSNTELDAILQSPDFYKWLREFHRGLMFGSLDGLPHLQHVRRVLARLAPDIWQVTDNGQRGVYRGGRVQCLNVPQAQLGYEPNGVPSPQRDAGGNCTGPGGACQEGFVEVHPWWEADPATKIKVCALDAQTRPTGLFGTNVDCADFRAGISDKSCGCGPNLDYCTPRSDPGNSYLRDSLVEEPLQIFEAVVKERRPYFDAFRTRESYVNGLVSHYYRHSEGYGVLFASDLGTMPSLPSGDRATWAKITRSARHSGILTTFAYLQRFASNRGRASHFYRTFMCQPFEADPNAAPPPPSDVRTKHPDLRQRPGCDGCHIKLEPAAAHFGRWRDRGHYGYLSAESYKASDPACVSCIPCTAECLTNRNSTACLDCRAQTNSCTRACIEGSRYHLSPLTNDLSAVPTQYQAIAQAEQGRLAVAAFLSASEAQALDAGPQALVAKNLPQMAQCTAWTLSERLLARPLTTDEITNWLPTLTANFQATQYDFLSLVKAIVNDWRYRSVR